MWLRAPNVMRRLLRPTRGDGRSDHRRRLAADRATAATSTTEGYLFLTDRIKDMIVSGGENVYPIEVEEALAQHPAVADVTVIGVPDERWGEAVEALVVRATGTPCTAEELVAFARERLAGYKVPAVVEFVDGFPRTPSGKVLKRELRERHAVSEVTLYTHPG